MKNLANEMDCFEPRGSRNDETKFTQKGSEMTTNSQKGHTMKKLGFVLLALTSVGFADIASETNAPAGQSENLQQIISEDAAKLRNDGSQGSIFEEKSTRIGDSGYDADGAARDLNEVSRENSVNFKENTPKNSRQGENLATENSRSKGENLATENASLKSVNFRQNLALKGTAPRSLGQVQGFAQNSNAKEFKAVGADTLSDAIRREKDVFFRDAVGGDAFANAYIRGFDRQRIGLYIDGVPLMDYDAGRNDYDLVLLSGFSQMQLFKAYTAPSHANTFGGVNLVSYTPQNSLEARLGLSLDMNSVGRNGTRTQKNVYVGTRGENYFFSADYMSSDRDAYAFSQKYDTGYLAMWGYQLNSKLENASVKLRAGWFNDNHEYSVNYYYQKGSKGAFVADAKTDILAAARNYDARLFDEWDDMQKQMIYVLGKSNFTQKLSLDSKFYYQAFDSQLINTQLTKNYSQSVHSVIEDYNDDAYGAMMALNYAFLPTQNAKLGFHLKRDAYINYKARVDKAYSRTAQLDLTEFKTSVFGEYGGKFGDFSLVLGASYERADILKARISSVSNNSTANLPQIISTTFDEINHKGDFTAQLAMLYEFNEANKAHLSAGKKLNYSTLHQRYFYGTTRIDMSESSLNYYVFYTPAFEVNKNLRPESVISYELGYDLTLPSTAVSVVGFYNDLYDGFMMQDTGKTVSPTNYASKIYPVYKLTNGYGGYNYGGEVSVEQGFFAENALLVGANYSYIYSKQRADDKAAPEFRHHNHIVNAKISFSPLRTANFTLLGTYQSKPVVNSLTQWIKGRDYFTLDLLANFYVGKGFTLKAGVFNLADRDNFINYESTIPNTATSGAAYSKDIYEYHLAGRRYMIGFEYNYQK